MVFERKAASSTPLTEQETPSENGVGRLRVVERGEGPSRRLEEVVGLVLRYGSILSIGTILVGIAMMVWSALHGGSSALTGPMVLSPTPFHNPDSLIAGLRAGDPSAVISLGLLILIATPVIRVASTVVYFLVHRDRVYLAITGFVLLVLMLGFLIGAGE